MPVRVPSLRVAHRHNHNYSICRDYSERRQARWLAMWSMRERGRTRSFYCKRTYCNHLRATLNWLLLNHQYHDCLLCPRPRGPVQSRPGSYLQACKVTESHGWAHVLCSVFIPEINFTNTSTMRSVEGITGIPNRRWMAVSRYIFLF